MQEIYNDIVEQKNIASQITKKMLTFMKDAEDMPIIGSVIDRQQKILNDCTEKKISLVKLQAAMMKQAGSTDGGGGPESFGKMGELSAEDKKILEKLVDEIDDKNNKEDDGKSDNGEKYDTK